jgi:four helix bundle protein
MSTIKNFEEIYAWQKAQVLAVNIYHEFQNLKDFGFKDQICRTVVSISNNIAEGFDRSSNAEFKRFLFYSKGSCSEVKSMLYLAEKLSYIGKDPAFIYIHQCEEISKLIQGFINKLH